MLTRRTFNRLRFTKLTQLNRLSIKVDNTQNCPNDEFQARTDLKTIQKDITQIRDKINKLRLDVIRINNDTNTFINDVGTVIFWYISGCLFIGFIVILYELYMTYIQHI